MTHRTSLEAELRVGIVQRVLPAYRMDFFDLLDRRCMGGLSIFTGRPFAGEAINQVSDGPEWWHEGSNVHFGRNSTYLCWQAGLMKWLRSWDPDALVVEANPRLVSSQLAIRWMRNRGRPVLGWGLGTMEVTSGWGPIRRRGRNRFIGALDGIITYSSRGRLEYAAAGVPEGKIFVAHNATRLRPRGTAPQRSVARPLTLLFVGRLLRSKRIDLLLQACADLPDQLRPTLRVVGDGPERPCLEALAREIYPHAVFLGALYGSELQEEWLQADLFVLPGQGGLAIQEAMSHGLPVIAGEGDGTQSDLVGRANGWLIEPNSVIALRGALEEAVQEPQQLIKMGRASFHIVRDCINVETMCDRFIEALRASVGKQDPARDGRSSTTCA